MALRMRNFALLLSEEDKDQGEHMKSCFQRDRAVCRSFFFSFAFLGGEGGGRLNL